MFNSEKQAIVRSEFAHLDEVLYFNTALTSIPPGTVVRAYEEESQRFYASFGSESGRESEQAAARRGVATLLGAQENEIALLGNTVDAISGIAFGYPWEAQKEVLLYEREHPSNLLPWLHARDAGLLKLRFIKKTGKNLRAQDVLDAIDDNTQAVAISAVQYIDGARVDLRAIGAECKRRGMLFIVDATQALGRLKIDVREMCIDYLAAGAHKGLLVRNGIGVCFCAARLLDAVKPPSASHQSLDGSITVVDGVVDIPYYESARRLENGNRCHPNVCALAASTALLNELGIGEIEQCIIELQSALYGLLGVSAGEIEPQGDMPSGIIKVDFPHDRREQAKDILRRHKAYASVRDDNIRFCISFYNTESQIAVLADIIAQLIALR